MIKNLFNLAIISTAASTLVSCGTIGGVGKDLQALGSTMEKVENKRPFSRNSQPAAIDPALLDQSYPEYPTQ